MSVFSLNNHDSYGHTDLGFNEKYKNICKYLPQESLNLVLNRYSTDLLMRKTLAKINEVIDRVILDRSPFFFNKIKNQTHGFAISPHENSAHIFIDYKDHHVKDIKIIAECTHKKVQPAILLHPFKHYVSLTNYKNQEQTLKLENQRINELEKDNPHIVPQFLCLVEVFGKDQTLRWRAYQKRLSDIDEIYKASPKIKLKLAKDYVIGLAKIHSQNYIHCDFKFENLFASKDCTLANGDRIKGYIGDLGTIAPTGDSISCQTTDFMGPEQLIPVTEAHWKERQIWLRNKAILFQHIDDEKAVVKRHPNGCIIKNKYFKEFNFPAQVSADLYTLGINLIYFATGLDRYDANHYFFEIDDDNVSHFLNLHMRTIKKDKNRGEQAKRVDGLFLDLARQLLLKDPAKRLPLAEVIKKIDALDS